MLALAVGTGAACWAAVTFTPAGSTRVAAVLVSLVGGLGVSWKGVGATLGKALTQAESSLWESEVAVAIGEAATVLPRRWLGAVEPLRTRIRSRTRSRVHEGPQPP